MAEDLLNVDTGSPVVPDDAPATAPVETTPSPADDMAADVRAAVEQVRARDTEAAERLRGPDGKFLPKAAVETPEAAPAAIATNSDPDSKTKPAAQASTPVPAGPPTSWSPEAKSDWSKLSPALQQAVTKREAEVSDGFRQKSEEAKAYAPLRELLEPRRQQFAAVGVNDPAEAVKQLLGFYDRFESNPADLIRHLAAQRGIDLRTLAAQSPTVPAANTAQAAPNARPASDPITVIRSEFDRRDAQSMLREFEGKPDNKHAQNTDVRRLMASYIATNPSATLQAAYDNAIWSVPALRDTLLAERDSMAKKATADKVAQAQRAAVSPRGSSPNGAMPAHLAAQPNGKGTVEDDVRAAMAQLGWGRN